MKKLGHICRVASFLVMLASQAAFGQSEVSVWMYDFPNLDNVETISYLSNMGVNQVFLSTDARQLPGGENYSQDYRDKVRDFLDKAHDADIRVHAMTLQDTIFTLREEHDRANQRVGWIVDFCNDISTVYPFVGIHIDTEPHAMQAWKDARSENPPNWNIPNDLMMQYVELLQTLQTTIGSSTVSLEFSAAIHWKYNEWSLGADGAYLPYGAADSLAKYTNFLVPMVFETSTLSNPTSTIYNRTVDEVEASPTVVGIQADAAKGFEDYAAVMAAVADLQDRFANQSNYRGVSVFKYATLRDMYQQTNPVVQLINPTHQQELEQVAVTFQWQSLPGTVQYRLAVRLLDEAGNPAANWLTRDVAATSYTWQLPSGRYEWKVRANNPTLGVYSDPWNFTLEVAPLAKPLVVPLVYGLAQNYPNPFNPTTTIVYDLPAPGEVILQVYNMLGQQIETLVDAYQLAGTYQVRWEGADKPSGIYFYHLQVNRFAASRRMQLVK